MSTGAQQIGSKQGLSGDYLSSGARALARSVLFPAAACRELPAPDRSEGRGKKNINKAQSAKQKAPALFHRSTRRCWQPARAPTLWCFNSHRLRGAAKGWGARCFQLLFPLKTLPSHPNSSYCQWQVHCLWIKTINVFYPPQSTNKTHLTGPHAAC